MDSRRTALVTGGAKRVSRAIVEKLAASGFDVLFTYQTSEAEARKLVSTLGSNGTRIEAFRTNLETESAAVEIANRVQQFAPRLDVLVNSASLYLPDSASPVTELTRRMMRINFYAPLSITHALATYLRSAHGRVINMLDLMAERPMPSYSIYCASKAALMNATISLARQLAPEVTVNGISPGVVDWPDELSETDREAYLTRVPLRRAGTPQDVANLVHFLATDGAYITGQVIRLDGGRSIV
ncbi:MAG: SDR family oxidoreductase [Burkholderiales bacterium]|nr:SDR family oxidoreductase [Phycisphaerae bacterium]